MGTYNIQQIRMTLELTYIVEGLTKSNFITKVVLTDHQIQDYRYFR